MKYNNDYKTDDKAWFDPVPKLNKSYDLKVQFLKINPQAQLPTRANEDDAGWDLRATSTVEWLSEDSGTMIIERAPKTVPTGLKMVIPPGWEAQVRPRSGLSLAGWKVCNSPGTIDAGYRGEIMVIMQPGPGVPLHELKIEAGTKIAQLVFKRVPTVVVSEITEEEFVALSNTERGEGGFGSSGVK